MNDDTETLLGSWQLSLYDKADSTRALYLDEARRFARWLPDGRGLLDVRRTDVERYLGALREQGLAGATIRSRWISLRSLYAWLTAEDEVTVNPLDGVKVSKVEAPPPKMPPDDDLARLWKVTAGRGFAERRDHALIRLVAATGGRISEVLALELGDVDLQSRIVSFRKAKGGRQRAARFDRETAAALDRYIRTRARHRFAHLPNLFLTRFGPLQRKGASAMLTRRCESAGVEPFGFHRLRHRYAHKWLSRGGSEDALARLGGWSDRSIMARYGSALAVERALEDYDNLGGVL